jgi:hypothetical protein
MSIVHPASGRGFYDWYRLTGALFPSTPTVVPEAFPMAAGDDTCSIRKTVALPG